jgi:hypothetical protein
MKTNRKLVGASHEGKYSYWEDGDRYVYQFNEIAKLCR